MKKSALLMVWMTVGALVGSVVAIAYSLRQATQLPDWYLSRSSQRDAATEIAAARPGELVLGSPQIQELVQGAIARQDLPPEWQEPAANFSATVQNGRLETGTVVNLSDLPLEELDERDRDRVERILSLVPGASGRDLFVGLETSPQVKDGRLELDGNTAVRLGQLRLPLNVVAQQFGISVDDLESELTEALQREGIALEQIRIEGDRIHIQSQP